MANELSGKVALIEYAGGFVASLDNWTVNVDTNMLDVTTFSTGDLQWRDFKPGLSGWTAAISGNFDSTSTGFTDLRAATLTPATGTVRLFADKVGGEAWNGNTFIQSMGNSAAIDGKVEIDFGLQGTGALTFSTTT